MLKPQMMGDPVPPGAVKENVSVMQSPMEPTVMKNVLNKSLSQINEDQSLLLVLSVVPVSLGVAVDGPAMLKVYI